MGAISPDRSSRKAADSALEHNESAGTRVITYSNRSGTRGRKALWNDLPATVLSLVPFVT